MSIYCDHAGCITKRVDPYAYCAQHTPALTDEQRAADRAYFESLRSLKFTALRVAIWGVVIPVIAVVGLVAIKAAFGVVLQ
jgi:hypothetical protein